VVPIMMRLGLREKCAIRRHGAMLTAGGLADVDGTSMARRAGEDG